MEKEIKGILVTFFREGTKGDYLQALNKAQNELLTVMEASKNLVQPDVIKSVCDYCGENDMNMVLCFECRTTRNDDKD
ncbi:MAG: hypothetical protein AABY22_10220 [Nanoarchaeota archaeon]